LKLEEVTCHRRACEAGKDGSSSAQHTITEKGEEEEDVMVEEEGEEEEGADDADVEVVSATNAAASL
jgi:hypothetical protein